MCIRDRTRLTLQTGQGVFINSGALHAVEPAEGRALLHSGVFQPRLVGGMDTVFWQKLIRPLLQPGTPPFFLLDEAVPWQRQVLDVYKRQTLTLGTRVTGIVANSFAMSGKVCFISREVKPFPASKARPRRAIQRSTRRSAAPFSFS